MLQESCRKANDRADEAGSGLRDQAAEVPCWCPESVRAGEASNHNYCQAQQELLTYSAKAEAVSVLLRSWG